MRLVVFRCSDGDFSPSGSPVFFFSCTSAGPQANPADLMRMLFERRPERSMQGCRSHAELTRCIWRHTYAGARSVLWNSFVSTDHRSSSEQEAQGGNKRKTDGVPNSVPKIRMYHTRKTNRVYPEHLTGAVVSYWRAWCSLWHHKRSIFTSVDISLWLVESLAMSGGFSHSLERRYPKLVGVSVQQCRSGRIRFELIFLIKTEKAVLCSVFKSKNTLYSPQNTVCVSLRWWETVMFSLCLFARPHTYDPQPLRLVFYSKDLKVIMSGWLT